MALCEFKSSGDNEAASLHEQSNEERETKSPHKEDHSIGEPPAHNDDLEDGEIEDDDEEETSAEQQPTIEQQPQESNENNAATRTRSLSPGSQHNKGPGVSPKHAGHGRGGRFDRGDRHRYEERKRGHLTEAEKSVMRLHKLERLEREKRDRYKREQVPIVDDFASNIEKAIANVLKKDKKQSGGEEEEDEKRGKKRKRKDKDRKKAKYKKGEQLLPILEDDDGPSGDKKMAGHDHLQSSHISDYDSHESSGGGSERGKDDRREKYKEHDKPKSKNKERMRNDKKGKDKRDYKTDLSRETTLCTFFLQGNCNKGDECPFLHQTTSSSLKLELCKFYLMDCCAKGDKCLYMHSQFPCKFYHLGLNCKAGEYCKFAHGGPLSEAHKQILFKHIETAPKEILGEFPRLNREGALAMLGQTQKALEIKYGMDKNNESGSMELNCNLIPSLFELAIPTPNNSDKMEKPAARERNRPSRWQNSDMPEDKSKSQPQGSLLFGFQGFYSERDQDMRVMSNGDVDMRTLLPPINPMLANGGNQVNPLTSDLKAGSTSDIDIREEKMEIEKAVLSSNTEKSEDELKLEIVTDDYSKTPAISGESQQKNVIELPSTLPKKQRELFLRIQAQQKENLPESNNAEASDEERNNIDWYSDDDEDDYRLTIKDDIDDEKVKEEEFSNQQVQLPSPIPTTYQPVEVIEKLGDLSKIDISAEVTKLLSSISQASSVKEPLADPRTAAKSIHSPSIKPSIAVNDPRRARFESTENENKREQRISIYEQGSLSIENSTVNKDVDLRNIEKDLDLRPAIYGDTDLRPSPSGRSDVDLRPLVLPFKAIQNYTPATEIDASINSHIPIQWRVYLVEIPQPDYAGLKLSAHEAQNTGDPRLKKLFKINTEEKDSPASPTKETAPKPVVTGIRADPRRRKLEEKLQQTSTDFSQINYSQQLNILQTSPFYQSLTSNQKVLLNQELSTRSDQSGNNDPTLNSILSNLGLIPGGVNTAIPNVPNATAINILTNVSNINPMLAQQNTNMMLLSQSQQFVQNPSMNPNMLNQNPGIVNQLAQSSSNIMVGGNNAANVVASSGMASEFQLNFDPRQGGLLGNAPPINFGQSDNQGGFNNYGGSGNDEFYDGNFGGNNMEESVSGPSGRGGGNRGSGRGRGFRDRSQHRRGGRNFNNGRNGGRNFRNNRNRSNRSRTPP